MNFCQPISPKGQKRRRKGFEKVDLSLTANREVLSSNPTKVFKNLPFRFNVSCVQSLISKQFNLKCDVQL